LTSFDPAKGRAEPMQPLSQFKIKIFADGADKKAMLDLYRNPHVRGFTTNPTLMHKAGVRDYEAFARDILQAIPDRPISFEVFADDFAEMERQARRITTWGKHVSVKIPIMNTRKENAAPLIARLSKDGIALNVTAIFLIEQVQAVADAVKGGAPCYVSVFAGRIADTGCDPLPLMIDSVRRLKDVNNAELLWASTRELLNIVQAEAIGCQIITVPNDIIKKLNGYGKDLHESSHETVRIFFDDGKAAGFTL
jgi:transaldolase